MSRAGPNISYCLTCAHLVNFTPPSEFLPHLENLIPILKMSNTITIANTNILVGRKILLPPNLYPPPKKIIPFENVLIRVIRVNFTFWKTGCLLLDLNSKIFTPGVKFLEFDNKYIIRCLLLKYRLIFYSSFCI